MVRLTDRPAMTIAVDLGRKATKQKKVLNSSSLSPSFKNVPNIIEMWCHGPFSVFI